jgi:hypothetical protein
MRYWTVKQVLVCQCQRPQRPLTAMFKRLLFEHVTTTADSQFLTSGSVFAAVLCDGMEGTQVMASEVAAALVMLLLMMVLLRMLLLLLSIICFYHPRYQSLHPVDNNVTVFRGMLSPAADAVAKQGVLRCANAMFSPGDC